MEFLVISAASVAIALLMTIASQIITRGDMQCQTQQLNR